MFMTMGKGGGEESRMTSFNQYIYSVFLAGIIISDQNIFL